MKTENKLLYLFIIFVFTPLTAQAEYEGPFIIIDKDGYTNIRKEPNGKSEIVGKVYKYQLLFLNSSYDEYEQKIIVNYADSAWIPVYNDSISIKKKY
jgi:hypothetical protein